MERDAVREQVAAKIAAQFGKEVADIHDEDHLAKDYGAKSHDLIRLSASLQAELGIKVNYAMTRKCHTVGEWTDLITQIANK